MFWKKHCNEFKERYNNYPSSVYSGITDDPDSWGMCCSKEMAYKCAEDYYDIYVRKDKNYLIKMICLGVFVVVLMMIPILILVF